GSGEAERFRIKRELMDARPAGLNLFPKLPVAQVNSCARLGDSGKGFRFAVSGIRCERTERDFADLQLRDVGTSGVQLIARAVCARVAGGQVVRRGAFGVKACRVGTILGVDLSNGQR